MPAVVAFLWLYGYASHVLLSKYLISVRGTGEEQYTGLILIQIWNFAKLICGTVDFIICWRSRRKNLGELLSSISDVMVYNPAERIYQQAGSAGRINPPSFGVDGLKSDDLNAARISTQGESFHGRAFTSDSYLSDDDDAVNPFESGFEDVPLPSTDTHSSSIESSSDCAIKIACAHCAKKLYERGSHEFGKSLTRENASDQSSREVHLISNLPKLDKGVRWKWFSWFVQGWLEMAALVLTFSALQWTFVGDCQTHRYWAVVFIALMQMFLDEETLYHSAIGVGLIVVGLSAKVILGTLTPRGESAYLETSFGAYMAFAAGVVYSLHMFLHELCVELTPNSGGYKCLVPEAIGALYLCWSIYPVLVETGSTRFTVGIKNLRQHWGICLWYSTSCLIAVTATVLQRKYSSPFARSVAFIMQLPIVYFVETVILRWHAWRIFDVIIIVVFLLGFSTMTATWPTTILGKHVHDFLYGTAFLKPKFAPR